MPVLWSANLILVVPTPKTEPGPPLYSSMLLGKSEILFLERANPPITLLRILPSYRAYKRLRKIPSGESKAAWLSALITFEYKCYYQKI